MCLIKNVFKNRTSGIALIFLLAFFIFLLLPTFALPQVTQTTKTKKAGFTSTKTTLDFTKDLKASFSNDDVEDDFDFDEIEIDVLFGFHKEYSATNSRFEEYAPKPSKFLNSFFYKKSNLFLLFCTLKLHLGSFFY